MSIHFFQMLAIVSGAILTFSALLYAAWRFFRRIVYIADAVEQLHPGAGGKSIADKVNGISIKMDRLEERMARVEHKVELSNNHNGGST